jgi:hypothetical protein
MSTLVGTGKLNRESIRDGTEKAQVLGWKRKERPQGTPGLLLTSP